MIGGSIKDEKERKELGVLGWNFCRGIHWKVEDLSFCSSRDRVYKGKG